MLAVAPFRHKPSARFPLVVQLEAVRQHRIPVFTYQHANMDTGGFFRLAEPIISRIGQRQIEANFANLKDLIETQA